MSKPYFIMNYQHPVWCNLSYANSLEKKAMRHSTNSVAYPYWKALLIVWYLKVRFPFWRQQPFKIVPLKSSEFSRLYEAYLRR